MRDIERMRRTLCAMYDNGGVATLQQCGVDRYAWFAGNAQLNTQIMFDLVNDGWVRLLPQYGFAVIETWPSFANDATNEEPAHG